MADQKIGRDAGSGRFIPVEEAKKKPKTTVIETIKKEKRRVTKNELGVRDLRNRVPFFIQRRKDVPSLYLGVLPSRQKVCIL